MNAPYAPPTLAALKAMSIRERAAVLLQFLHSKDPSSTYDPNRIDECAIAQFRQTLVDTDGDTSGAAGWIDYTMQEGRVIVIPGGGLAGFTCWDWSASEPYAAPTTKTFGAIADALEARIASYE